MSLEKFGWNSYFQSEYLCLATPESKPARVTAADRERFVVWGESGEREATVSGRLRYSSDLWPAVGDWVALESGCRIAAVVPRQTAFSRKRAGDVTEQQVVAANIDVVFIVTGLDGDFNLRRIERYLLLARESGTRPVILLNKGDLATAPEGPAGSVAAVAAGAPVAVISALQGWGLEALDAYLEPGQTVALVGSSGAGKSTLVNRILGREQQRVREVRAGDNRGRHTTVRRELFPTSKGWLLIDTPGMRELQLWAHSESIDFAFDDIAALAAHCRFRDCKHRGEPGCAVAAAGLDESRLANYAKLQRELAHLERQQDQRAAQDEKRRIKRIHRAMRGKNRI